MAIGHLSNKQQPFYDHYTGQPVLVAPPVKNWRILS